MSRTMRLSALTFPFLLASATAQDVRIATILSRNESGDQAVAEESLLRRLLVCHWLSASSARSRSLALAEQALSETGIVSSRSASSPLANGRSEVAAFEETHVVRIVPERLGPSFRIEAREGNRRILDGGRRSGVIAPVDEVILFFWLLPRSRARVKAGTVECRSDVWGMEQVIAERLEREVHSRWRGRTELATDFRFRPDEIVLSFVDPRSRSVLFEFRRSREPGTVSSVVDDFFAEVESIRISTLAASGGAP